MKSNLITRLEEIGAKDILWLNIHSKALLAGEGVTRTEKGGLKKMSKMEDPTFLRVECPIKFTYKFKAFYWEKEASELEKTDKRFFYYHEDELPFHGPIFYPSDLLALNDLYMTLNRTLNEKFKKIGGSHIDEKYNFYKLYDRDKDIKIQLDEFVSFIEIYEEVKTKLGGKVENIIKKADKKIFKLVSYLKKEAICKSIV